MLRKARRVIRMNEGKSHQREWKATPKDIILTVIGGIAFIGQIALCFLRYNSRDLDAVLYVGWALLAVAWLVAGMSRRAFEEKGGAPEGRSWLATILLVDSGIYGVVRHPQYLSFMLVPLSLMLISQHWLSAVLGVPSIVLLYVAMGMEEETNIEKFGDDYERYMERVPKANVVAGVIRLLQRRSKE
jgi:protein-S-isoprenylcysteine O-methyltransferase Ste14